MRKTLLLTILSAWLMAHVTAQEIVLSNAGFENDKTDWTCQAGNGAAADYQIDNTTAKEGSKSLKIDVTAVTANYWDIQALNIALSGTMAGTYKVSVWAKASTTTQKMNFNVSKATSDYSTYAEVKNQALTTDWVQYTFALPVLTTPLNDLRVCFNFLSVGTYWVDGISIAPSVVVSSQVLAAGNKLQIIFTDEISDPALEANIPFVIKANDLIYTVGSVARDAVNMAMLTITLNEKITKGAKVELNYYPGTLSTTSGKEFAAFTLTPDNKSTVVASAVASNIVTKIEAYPNPCTNMLLLELAGNSNTCAIYDITGKCQYKCQLQSGKNILNVNALKSGLYMLKITGADNKTVFSQKVVKR